MIFLRNTGLYDNFLTYNVYVILYLPVSLSAEICLSMSHVWIW
jgi:hypothetical protein